MEVNTTCKAESYPIDRFTTKAIVIGENFYIDKSTLVIPKNYTPFIDKVVLSKGMMLDRIDKIAQEITKDYFDKNVILLIVMKGAVVFGSTLVEKINDILSNDITNSYSMSFSVEYVDIKSYVDDKSTGDVKIKIDEKVAERLRGQNVIVVEDIYDSGKSLYELDKFLLSYSPLSLKSTVLIQKMNLENLKNSYEVDYIGFLVPNSFIIGFGMDYNEKFRHLYHLCVINSEGIKQFKSKN
jgi:hypoxanthine phosphoribosyltransferase